MVDLPLEQQLYLQAIISRRVLPERKAVKLYDHCCNIVNGANGDPVEFSSALASIQDVLDPIGLSITKRHDPYTGKPWHAIINATSDDIAKIATEYSPEEIAYFKVLVKLIMESPHQSFSIPVGVALRAGSDEELRPPLSNILCQKLCSSFVAKGWLFRSANGYYMLGNRALMELDMYLKAEYPAAYEDSLCALCKELVTRGYACAISDCSCRMHKHCAKKWLQSRPQCPVCHSEWNQSLSKPIGEEASLQPDENNFSDDN